MTIEDRINSCSADSRVRFIDDLLKSLKKPGMMTEGVYYLKDDAAGNIATRLRSDGVRFDEALCDFAGSVYGQLRKVPLKQVGYGLLNATLPREVAEQLTPWEALYAYAGIWFKKSTPNGRYWFNRAGLERQTTYHLVRDLVFEGMRRIKYVHNREHEQGRYKHRMLKVPSEDAIMQRLKPAMLKKEQCKEPEKNGQMRLF
jgi:hypothetical protein